MELALCNKHGAVVQLEWNQSTDAFEILCLGEMEMTHEDKAALISEWNRINTGSTTPDRYISLSVAPRRLWFENRNGFPQGDRLTFTDYSGDMIIKVVKGTHTMRGGIILDRKTFDNIAMWTAAKDERIRQILSDNIYKNNPEATFESIDNTVDAILKAMAEVGA